MRWTPGGSSDDVEDRRDDSGGGGMQFGGIHIGIGGFLLLLILSIAFHRNFFALLGGGTGAPTAMTQQDPEANRQQDEAERPLVEFVTFVLNDTQATWTKILASEGAEYRHSKLVLFRNSLDSACGTAQTATGPFYCPEDQKVYLDLGFFDELSRRFGAPGQFAQAYVVAHEIGHHVQKLLGIETKAHAAQQRSPQSAKAISVRLELQADCFAGVWGHSTDQRHLLESGDVDSALRAASAVGDDRLQRMTTGHVNPDSFTHGSSEQRTQWFQRGFNGGTIESCNTFAD
ncbi:MAG TPA: neutral zinc metallopeptidase [Candidatus Sulfotelmatobacter sp.]|nr:neutral zinc metallopeptidase [Candidatus Sulfotelmatobacter sp.]